MTGIVLNFHAFQRYSESPAATCYGRCNVRHIIMTPALIKKQQKRQLFLPVVVWN